jgi:hypothetical protein
MERQEREETAIVFPFFRSVAKFKIDAMARVLNDRLFELHRLETDLDRGHETDRFGTDGAFGGPLDRALGPVVIAATASDPQQTCAREYRDHQDAYRFPHPESHRVSPAELQ